MPTEPGHEPIFRVKTKRKVNQEEQIAKALEIDINDYRNYLRRRLEQPEAFVKVILPDSLLTDKVK
jgi:DNA-directed RNA polymerase subunit L